MSTTKEVRNETIEVKELQELISLISRLDPEQKKTVLATIRGAVLMADSSGGQDDDIKRTA